MANKLKTLKDLEWTEEKIDSEMSRRLRLLEDTGDKEQLGKNLTQGKHIDSIEIKQEARKQLDYKFAMALNAPDVGIKDFLLGQCAFIEEFFNIDKNDTDVSGDDNK